MGECPMWEEETRQLVYVDINARTVCRWNPTLWVECGLSSHTCVADDPYGLTHLGGDPSGCVALCREGIYMVASGTCLGFLDRETGQVEWAAWLDHDKPHNRFKDGKVDPTGRFEAAGHPNGLDWSLDHCTLYHVDSLVYCVRAYDYNMQTGGLANPWLVCQLEPEQGMPDGLCMDTTGTLWVACIDGGRVIRVDPETVDSLSPEQLLLELQAGHIFK
ncbi:regucalcin-like, partial [Marmota monax]|uniref:regucalcin-like n=1 Tax=Marmota monax TaxID=9995 RepID=UPI001EB07F54